MDEKKIWGVKEEGGGEEKSGWNGFFWGVGDEEEGVMLGRIVYYGCIL